MSGIENKTGIKPKCRDEFAIRDQAMSGDIIIEILTADVNEAAAATGWTYAVKFQLTNAAGIVHNWYNGTIDAVAGDTSVLGTATISSATPNVVDGIGTVNLIGDAVAWVAAEDATATLSGTVLGVTLGAKVFTVTIV